ncbi:hypothetical protein NBRC110019_19400 [Neptunitalea chrysea]|uniref:Uncharacterized protein n=1 Tax=Neptunitalea chrysea TaxID=1647581 RepID=A0A9W6B5F5_9FLAO|nr:hypothetical protein [Neptunitalea chrysea]GLB52900.1 hypothetical protein NBRC110019_19400 [Neptunitalea chrysea]
MSNQSNQDHNSDEIDIIQFFAYLGKSIQNFFKSIGNLFKWIFHVFILLLLLIKKNIIYFVIALVIGVVAGVFLDKTKAPTYTSEMVVEPNFNSSIQLYNQIAYFSDLAVSKDSITLAKAMKITPSEAGKIVSFSVEALVTERQKLYLYDKFIKGLDTLTQKSFDYEMYSNNFNDFDAAYHTVKVVSTDNTVVKKLENSIVASVSQNPYFKEQEKIKKTNIALQDTILRKQLVEIDSMQIAYRESMVAAAENPGAGASISLSDDRNNNFNGVELIEQINNIRRSLVKLNEDKGTQKASLNVISEFPDRGIKVIRISREMKVVLPLLFITLVFVVILLLRLNTFLKAYNK